MTANYTLILGNCFLSRDGSQLSRHGRCLRKPFQPAFQLPPRQTWTDVLHPISDGEQIGGYRLLVFIQERSEAEDSPVSTFDAATHAS